MGTHRRAIFWSSSKDFLKWTLPQELEMVPKYPEYEQLYTNAVTAIPGVKGLWVSDACFWI